MSGLRLTKIERLQLDVMRQELTPWGLPTALMMGGKHLKLKVWGRDGAAHVLIISCTPRNDGMALDHARQKARRLARELAEREGY